MQKFAEITSQARSAAAVVVTRARHAMLAALAAAVTLTAVAEAGPDAATRTFTFTENGVQFSLVWRLDRRGHSLPVESISTNKLPGRTDLAQQVRRGSTGRRGDHLLDELP